MDKNLYSLYSLFWGGGGGLGVGEEAPPPPAIEACPLEIELEIFRLLHSSRSLPLSRDMRLGG